MKRSSLALIASLVLLQAAAADARPVHIRGTAYEFNNTKVRLGGATIRVAERPAIRANVRPNGSYDLVVPDHARITPYIVAPGYHTIHLQTFRTAGEDLYRVNFQTPRESIYRALAALLNVQLYENGELVKCAIVSTFSTRNVRDLSFNAFTDYGAHGVAGASAYATPDLGGAVYFNEDVIPDPNLPISSIDGGVLWTQVPRGTYTIRARHPSTRFASFVATCVPGRVINANPPWGLHELGKRNRARLSARRLSRLPVNATVRLRCSGPGCPFKTRVRKPDGTSLKLPDPDDGQTLEILVTAHAYDGKLFRLRPGSRPQRLCVPLGNVKPRRRC
jgi:hypothetical protein